MKDFFKQLTGSKEKIVALIVIAIAAIAQGWNIFQFPHYTGDEGTYMSYSWSLVTHGSLSNYTYWYDHAPAGWILLGIWAKLTGGFFTFGTAVNSGRVFILLLHIGMSVLLIFISKKLTSRQTPGIVAVLLFSFSPLALFFGTRVLLDNIMIFWIFLSLALLLKDRIKLSSIIASAVCFAISVLTKENAIFFTPPFLYLLFTHVNQHHKRFAILSWILISSSIISVYLLYALLNSELLPNGVLNNKPHVSLLETLGFQLSRGNSFPFWNPKSDFYSNFLEWSSIDNIFITAAVIASALAVILSVFIRYFRVIALLIVCFWLFLIRGKVVYDIYIIPIIPIAALTISLVLDYIVSKITFGIRFLYYPLFIAILFAYGYIIYPVVYTMVTADETLPQVKAISYIKHNVDPHAEIVIDDSFFIDLHDRSHPSDPVFTNADWDWKIEKDPAITQDKLHNNWTNLKYLVSSDEVTAQVKGGVFPNIKKMQQNSHIIKSWSVPSYGKHKIPGIDDNYTINLYKLNDTNSIILKTSWEQYLATYFHSYGAIYDIHAKTLTSRLQAKTLLMAVLANDKTHFDSVYQWTKDHMEYRSGDKLFSSTWDLSGNGHVINSETDAFADETIAYALLVAARQWDNVSYSNEARKIIQDVWKKDVVPINASPIITSGSQSAYANGYTIDINNISPAYYAAFGAFDGSHKWDSVTGSSYKLLDYLASTHTATESGNVTISKRGFVDFASSQSATASALSQISFNVDLSYKLSKNETAIKLLKKIAGSYSQNASVSKQQVLPLFSDTNVSKALMLYKNNFVAPYNYNADYWNNITGADIFTTQWLQLALYTGRAKNVINQ